MSDLIERQAAIDAHYEYCNKHPDAGFPVWSLKILEDLPSSQSERPKGEWIHQSKFSRIECDQCGKVFRNTFAPKNFCPNCGADMRGKTE